MLEGGTSNLSLLFRVATIFVVMPTPRLSFSALPAHVLELFNINSCLVRNASDSCLTDLRKSYSFLIHLEKYTPSISATATAKIDAV